MTQAEKTTYTFKFNKATISSRAEQHAAHIEKAGGTEVEEIREDKIRFWQMPDESCIAEIMKPTHRGVFCLWPWPNLKELKERIRENRND